jgi:hypothetical protein
MRFEQGSSSPDQRVAVSIESKRRSEVVVRQRMTRGKRGDGTDAKQTFLWHYGTDVPTCALVMLTSVLLTMPLAFTSFRKLDAVTGAAT